MVEVHHHHQSRLKQTNKKFKSKHATKSSLKDAAKGRVHCTNSKASAPKTSGQWKLNRRNTARQAQTHKRETLVSATRIFSGADGVPRIVAVIPLSADVKSTSIVASLSASLDISADDCPPEGLWKMKAERFRTSLQFITTSYRNFYVALDACKVADYVVFALSTTMEVDTWGDTLLRALQAQGLGQVVTVAAPNHSLDNKDRSGILKSLLSFIQYFVPSQTRLFDLHTSSDQLNAVRALSEGKPGDVRWREGRPWILCESTLWEDGVLKVTGIVRGASLSVNRLVHLPNFGDFQLAKIMSAPLPRHVKAGKLMGMELEPAILAEPSPDEIESLTSSNDPDDLANEQTWPTEEEMNNEFKGEKNTLPNAEAGTTPKYVKRIPKGMSAYQATWIIEEDDDEGEQGETEENMTQEETGDTKEDIEMEDMHMDEDMESDDNHKMISFHDLDVEEDEKQLKSWRNREREEEEDFAFPDEIDTPRDIPARVRFQRYRGLRSFRTSPWDPFENLPRDYGRIFQFEDFKRTERNIRSRVEQALDTVHPGIRVTLYLKNVPREASAERPLALFGLLQHEHKISVLHFSVQRNTEYGGSVRSKDPLVLCVGARRLRTNPIYSQLGHGGGKGANNVHKFERFLRHGLTNVATVYGPIIYGKQPCVFLRETSDAQAPELVATGIFLNPDTTRVIAKRIILTGHPFKVHRKTATVRYMFFNPEDINYFRPVQLHTKYGRMGHIRESLGTHGYLKAHFDGPITQMDTVCMSLYKRVFPKWSVLWTKTTNQDDIMEE